MVPEQHTKTWMRRRIPDLRIDSLPVAADVCRRIQACRSMMADVRANTSGLRLEFYLVQQRFLSVWPVPAMLQRQLLADKPLRPSGRSLDLHETTMRGVEVATKKGV